MFVYCVSFVCAQDCDHSNPNWEFLQKIREFLSRLELRPLQGDEEVSGRGWMDRGREREKERERYCFLSSGCRYTVKGSVFV